MIGSSVLSGFKGLAVMVEVDLKRGIPNTLVTGLPRGALLESVDRIRAAIRNSGFSYPQEKVLINLSPAGIIKSGSGFDLPIALAILSKIGLLSTDSIRVMAIGELQLSGHLLSVEGILNAVLSLRDQFDCFLIPKNTVKSHFKEDDRVVEAASLSDAVAVVQAIGKRSCPDEKRPPGSEVCILPPAETGRGEGPEGQRPGIPGERGRSASEEWDCFENCRLSAETLGRLTLAAATGMHAFFYGAPGTGKSYASEFLYRLLPKNGEAMALAVSQIHSAVGEYGEEGFMTEPPFRCPHHSASVEGVIGGGREIRPGEVTLAHGGLLFLDEAPEFKPSILQGLREPMETGRVSIARVGGKVVFPADFQLVLSANLCPCGEFGRFGSLCICSMKEMTHYWNRIGGALFDRIPIRIPFAAHSSPIAGLSVDKLQEGVRRFRHRWEESSPSVPYRHASPVQLFRCFPQPQRSLHGFRESCERLHFSLQIGRAHV